MWQEHYQLKMGNITNCKQRGSDGGIFLLITISEKLSNSGRKKWKRGLT
jgi:hypothetical protein